MRIHVRRFVVLLVAGLLLVLSVWLTERRSVSMVDVDSPLPENALSSHASDANPSATSSEPNAVDNTSVMTAQSTSNIATRADKELIAGRRDGAIAIPGYPFSGHGQLGLESSPSGKLILAIGGRWGEEYAVFDTAKDEWLSKVRGGADGTIISFHWLDDSAFLTVSGDKEYLYRSVNVQTGEVFGAPLPSWVTPESRIEAAVPVAGGQKLLVVIRSPDTGSDAVYIADVDGESAVEVTEFRSLAEPVDIVRLSGRNVTTSSDGVHALMDIGLYNGAVEWRELVYLTFDPDGHVEPQTLDDPTLVRMGPMNYRISSDGQGILFVLDGEIHEFVLSTGQLHQVTDGGASLGVLAGQRLFFIGLNVSGSERSLYSISDLNWLR